MGHGSPTRRVPDQERIPDQDVRPCHRRLDKPKLQTQHALEDVCPAADDHHLMCQRVVDRIITGLVGLLDHVTEQSESAADVDIVLAGLITHEAGVLGVGDAVARGARCGCWSWLTQTVTVPSADPVASQSPSGLHATEDTLQAWPTRVDWA